MTAAEYYATLSPGRKAALHQQFQMGYAPNAGRQDYQRNPQQFQQYLQTPEALQTLLGTGFQPGTTPNQAPAYTITPEQEAAYRQQAAAYTQQYEQRAADLFNTQTAPLLQAQGANLGPDAPNPYSSPALTDAYRQQIMAGFAPQAASGGGFLPPPPPAPDAMGGYLPLSATNGVISGGGRGAGSFSALPGAPAPPTAGVRPPTPGLGRVGAGTSPAPSSGGTPGGTPIPVPGGTPSGQQGGGTFLPNPFPTTTNPAAGGAGVPPNIFGDFTDAAASNPADQFLAYGAGDVGYLRGIAENAGYATDATPAWEAMLAAQQRNIERNAANLGEQFNVSGNRFSTAFGDAMTDYYGQAALDQNALLGQLTLGSQEAARGRELGAGQTLAGLGYGGAQQLSSQGFQSLLQQGQQGYGLTSQLLGNAADASNLMATLGAQGAQGLNQNAMLGGLQMYGAENQAAMAEMERQLELMRLGFGGGADLSNLWNQGLQTGGALGGMQYGIEQDAMDRMYNEWLRQQPAYNPLLPYMYSGATGNQTTYYPQYQPPQLPGILSGLGGIFGALGPWLQGLGGGDGMGNT